MFLARKIYFKNSLINKWNIHFKTVENSLKWDTHLSGTKSDYSSDETSDEPEYESAPSSNSISD